MDANGSRSSLRSSLGRPTLDEHLDASGLGAFQGRLFFMLALVAVADGMVRCFPPHARALAMFHFFALR